MNALQARIAAAKASAANMTAPGAAGGDYEPPAEGLANVRLCGYVELGIHKEHNKDKNKDELVNKVRLIFEVSGAKWPARDTDDGPVPIRIYRDLRLSNNEKATIVKLFTKMNKENPIGATNIMDYLDVGMRMKIVHNKKEKGTFANLEYESVTGPFREGEDGSMVPVTVAPLLGPVLLFTWGDTDLDGWNSLFVAGEWPERKDDDGKVTRPAASKNVLQNLIKSAVNFDTHPLAAAINSGATASEQAEMDEAMGIQPQRAAVD